MLGKLHLEEVHRAQREGKRVLFFVGNYGQYVWTRLEIPQIPPVPEHPQLYNIGD